MQAAYYGYQPQQNGYAGFGSVQSTMQPQYDNGGKGGSLFFCGRRASCVYCVLNQGARNALRGSLKISILHFRRW
jgi:hypothetical protein